MDLSKYLMTCIHNYSIIQSIFTVPKILCALPTQHSSISKSLATTVLFTVYIALSFPECRIVGLIQNVTALVRMSLPKFI